MRNDLELPHVKSMKGTSNIIDPFPLYSGFFFQQSLCQKSFFFYFLFNFVSMITDYLFLNIILSGIYPIEKTFNHFSIPLNQNQILLESIYLNVLSAASLDLVPS